MISTLLAGLEKSLFDREIVEIGGGEYSEGDLAEAILYIKKGIDAAEKDNLTESTLLSWGIEVTDDPPEDGRQHLSLWVYNGRLWGNTIRTATDTNGVEKDQIYSPNDDTWVPAEHLAHGADYTVGPLYLTTYKKETNDRSKNIRPIIQIQLT